MKGFEYRFWDLINNCWTTLSGELLPKIEKYNHAIFCFIKEGEPRSIEITEYIGHKDNNKKKIFVGDWVEDQKDKELFLIMYNGEKIFTRRFYQDIRCHCDNCINEDVDPSKMCYTYEDLDLRYAIYNVLVVGNIFENEEMYKGKGE